jgi:hypothetical protein
MPIFNLGAVVCLCGGNLFCFSIFCSWCNGWNSKCVPSTDDNEWQAFKSHLRRVLALVLGGESLDDGGVG